jgi:hypothetical protein
MVSMISPPSIKKYVKYDPSVRSLVDVEAIEWSRCYLLNLGVDH